MKRIILLALLLLSISSQAQLVQSPNELISLEFNLSERGTPFYTVKYKNKYIVVDSNLGFNIKNQLDLISDFEITESESHAVKKKWNPVLGENKTILNEYNELYIQLTQSTTKRKLNLYFRIFNDGVAFRYEFPKQKNLNHFVISNEVTEFNLTGDHKAFWMPGDFDSNEYVYNETLLSEINTEKLDYNNGIGAKGIADKYTVQSPLLMKTKDNIYLTIFEAAVINYPVMHLMVNPQTSILRSQLVPNAIGDKAYLQTPCVTPWRTILVSDNAVDMVKSNMTLNLNEPSVIENTSWIKPMKYVGIWWEMHVGKSSWGYANNHDADVSKLIPNGIHGATTENTKKYIDFAKKHNFDGVLIEGWNVGWEDWAFNWKEDVFDFVTPYPDFDLNEVTRYAKEKNIKLIMHHETSASVGNYERRLDRAFDFMKKHGYDAVKTGYVGKIIPRGEMHDGQAMVNHYLHVVKRAADYKIMVNSHESSRPTGVHRTYPNYISAEAARGNEFNAWSNGNPPSHETILPFTRLLGGPMDYTPGIFQTKISHYFPKNKHKVNTTIAKQLALYVTMYSPLQMAADLPENYEKHLDAFQFIKDVSADWDNTIVLEAEPGDYLTIARKTKGKDSWFLGAITDENERETKIELSFLDPETKYEAIIYEDGKKAHWDTNPHSYNIQKTVVTNQSKIKLNLAPGGGTAISFSPIK